LRAGKDKHRLGEQCSLFGRLYDRQGKCLIKGEEGKKRLFFWGRNIKKACR